ncbi:MAG TPA: hypothetical protein VHE79_02700 [Spirochaetia bacterium]
MERTGLAVWDPVEIPQKKCVLWQFPLHSIWVERVESEWHVLTRSVTARRADSRAGFIARGKKPTSSQWRHYLHRTPGPVQPMPVMPDRPIVIRPDRSLSILPGQSTVFFLELPVWFRLSTGGYRPTTVFEEPLTPLTRTWFGDPVNGELCWGRATRLHHALESVEHSACVAVCPLMIENSAEIDLAFEKICIHVENLSLFMGERLWTNSLHAVFMGPEPTTEIEITHDAPEFEPGLRLVTPARHPSAGWNIRRTFGVLKYFTNFQ